LIFNHHEVIPQLPEGQHHDAKHHITAKQHHSPSGELHCEATSLRSNFTAQLSGLFFQAKSPKQICHI
jgi:hypothetical protein